MQIKPKEKKIENCLSKPKRPPGFLPRAHRTIADINQHFLTFQSREKSARKMEIALRFSTRTFAAAEQRQIKVLQLRLGRAFSAAPPTPR
jgi:hypothetical protein